MRRLILCFALLWPISVPCLLLTAPVAVAQAATLTPAQLATIKADILADGTLNAFPNTPDGNFAIAAAYAVTASPDFWVWKTFLTKADCTSVTSVDATEWSWTIFIARSQGERDAWREMFDDGSVNPSRVNIRNGIADIFSGGPGAPQRTHLLAVARRKATRVEKLLATGTGSTASPATMGFEGKLTHDQVAEARNLP